MWMMRYVLAVSLQVLSILHWLQQYLPAHGQSVPFASVTFHSEMVKAVRVRTTQPDKNAMVTSAAHSFIMAMHLRMLSSNFLRHPNRAVSSAEKEDLVLSPAIKSFEGMLGVQPLALTSKSLVVFFSISA